MKELIELIKQHKEDFADSVVRRMNTSTANKSRHVNVLGALYMDDWDLLEELLQDSWYRKPLDGVIICMNCDFEVKSLFITAYKKL